MFKALDDIGVIMTPFGDVVTVILVANIYVLGEMTRINFSSIGSTFGLNCRGREIGAFDVNCRY